MTTFAAKMCEKNRYMVSVRAVSVLIPTFNCVCLKLVEGLCRLLEKAAGEKSVDGFEYEIIVADDGSTDAASVEANRPIASLPHCQYIVRPENQGRAAIRNFLAQTARFDYLLFIDSDMSLVSDQYISRYLSVEEHSVIDGGVAICGDSETGHNHSGQLGRNLRWLYEKAEEPRHTAAQRQTRPWQHLHTANLLIPRDVMRCCPFDERFRHYGYEDVLLGKTLHREQIPVVHIDNPLGFSTFESNPDFVAKTEEGLRTLHEFRSDLRGYSRLLTFVSGIHIPLILTLIRLFHRLFGKAERRNLCGSRPSLLIFRLYRLGYYLSLR